MMVIKKLPRIENYWSASLNFCCELPPLKQFMSSHRFLQIWSNLHVVDDSTLSGNGLTRKFKPILDVLSRTFLSNYSPSQELSDKAKVCMSNKPKEVWCCCCGYLCTYQVYEGKPIDPATSKSTSEKGMVTLVVKDLV